MKIERFGNEGQEDWMVFKHHISSVVMLNQYNDYQARLALSSAMTGKAALATLDIDPTAAGLTYPLMLAAFEGRFLPASASQMARVKFDAARQGPSETVLDFHARLRSLYNKAYPNAVDVVNLIRRFTMGLRRREVRTQVLRHNPHTYENALEVALNESSVLQMVKVTELGATQGVEPMEIGAMNEDANRAKQDKRGKCHYCDRPGHWKAECRLLKKNMEKLVMGQASAKEASRSKKKRFNNNARKEAQKILAALWKDDLTDDDEEEDDDDSSPPAGSSTAAGGNPEDF